MMVFSGLLKASSSSSETRPRALSRNKTSNLTENGNFPASQEYIYEQSQIPLNILDDADLKDLNNGLVVLAAIFPDVQVEVFREMLSSFTDESRLAVVTEALLKSKLTWVRGRYRIAGKEESKVEKNQASKDNARGTVPLEDSFRNSNYMAAVKVTAYNEFRGLSHSTIRAVLAEHNHSYSLARPTLIALNAKSWRFSFSAIFSRTKKVTTQESEQHPLVVWQSTGFGSITPSLKTTGNAELDRELFNSLIVPLLKKTTIDRDLKDRNMAVELNNKEAEDCEALHDCECCYTSYTFEELTACDGGHLLCFQCVRHAVNEAVFGQGWARNIDLNTGSLRCIAPMTDDCSSSVSRELLERALIDENAGQDILNKLDERLVADSLLKTRLPLVRCPFCSYAEIDELYLPSTDKSWRFRHNGPYSLYTFALLLVIFGSIPFLLPFLLIFTLALTVACSKRTSVNMIETLFRDSLMRQKRRQQGLRFTCQNAQCSRASCVSCSKAWSDIHICHESSLLALRTQVELAMSLAIKRTCPRCNTSFVKSSGCNKLTCVCGYQMCYVCRKDIGSGEGYRHFCEHFRPTGGGGCQSCEKCDLYRCEDDEIVVKKAKEAAEKRWMEKEGAGAESGEILKALAAGNERGWASWSMPDWEKVVDTVVDFLIE